MTDLYDILIAYANKSNSPYINITEFITFLERYAKRQSEEHPQWQKWTKDASIKFWSELSPLVEEGKLELLPDTGEGRIYVPHYYIELLQRTYLSIDDTADLPFPSEDSLGIILPENQVHRLSLEYDLAVYMEECQDSPPSIIKLIFPEGFGSALVLPDMIPRRIMEAALLKVRNYLRGHSNKEYTQQKLTPQFQGKEHYLRNILNQILTRPPDCLNAMEEGGDFVYLFWAYFSSLIKNDIRKKKEPQSEDIAVIQAVYLIEVCNSYYKAKALKNREREIAFKNLDLQFDKPPFLYTLEAIVRFTSSKGVLLLGQYSQAELEAWIKNKVTVCKDDELPEMLIISNQTDKWYIKKQKIVPLCSQLLSEARFKVQKAVSKRWFKLIKTYRKEPAMENDNEFEELLSRYTDSLCPILTTLLEDPKLFLVYKEIERAKGVIPESAKIFNKDATLPLSVLLSIKRKDMLADTKLILPLWYSIPIITAIIAFFAGLGKNKRKKKAQDNIDFDKENEINETHDEKDPVRKLRETGREFEAALVPPGYTSDEYLDELERRWSRLLNKQAREDLVEDVNALVRDYLRHSLRRRKHFKLTKEILNQMALNIIFRAPALQELSAQDSLRAYIEIYIIKLLLSVKF